MKRFFKLYRIEQKLFLRSADIFIFGVCMPVVALVLICMIAGHKTASGADITYLESSFVALSAVGICCCAFMSIPITLVDYRDKKILKHIYCSPCSPIRLLLADVLCSAVMAILSAVCVSLVACIFFGYRMTGNVCVYILCWLLTMVSMFSIGLLVASLCKTAKSMSVVTTLLYFPMLLFSGTTVPYEVFPTGLQKLADVLPLGVGIKLMKSASVGADISSNLSRIFILLGITVVCTAISSKTFKWE